MPIASSSRAIAPRLSQSRKGKGVAKRKSDDESDPQAEVEAFRHWEALKLRRRASVLMEMADFVEGL